MPVFFFLRFAARLFHGYYMTRYFFKIKGAAFLERDRRRLKEWVASWASSAPTERVYYSRWMWRGGVINLSSESEGFFREKA